MALRGCSQWHFIQSMKHGSVIKIMNVDTRKRPPLKIHTLEDIYKREVSMDDSLPSVHPRDLFESSPPVCENSPTVEATIKSEPEFYEFERRGDIGENSEDLSFVNLTLKQIQESCITKKKKRSRSLFSSNETGKSISSIKEKYPNSQLEDDGYDLEEPLSNWKCKISNRRKAKRKRTENHFSTSEANVSVDTNELISGDRNFMQTESKLLNTGSKMDVHEQDYQNDPARATVSGCDKQLGSSGSLPTELSCTISVMEINVSNVAEGMAQCFDAPNEESTSNAGVAGLEVKEVDSPRVNGQHSSDMLSTKPRDECPIISNSAEWLAQCFLVNDASNETVESTGNAGVAGLEMKEVDSPKVNGQHSSDTLLTKPRGECPIITHALPLEVISETNSTPPEQIYDQRYPSGKETFNLAIDDTSDVMETFPLISTATENPHCGSNEQSFEYIDDVDPGLCNSFGKEIVRVECPPQVGEYDLNLSAAKTNEVSGSLLALPYSLTPDTRDYYTHTQHSLQYSLMRERSFLKYFCTQTQHLKPALNHGFHLEISQSSDNTVKLSGTQTNTTHQLISCDDEESPSMTTLHQQPERLLSARKIISPACQDRLRKAVKNLDHQGNDDYKCKEKLYFSYPKRHRILRAEGLDDIRLADVCLNTDNINRKKKGIQKRAVSKTKSAIEFSQQQMRDFERLTQKLTKELKSMKDIMQGALQSDASTSKLWDHNINEVKTAIENATRTEETTKKWFSVIERNCGRFCKVMKLAEDTPAAEAQYAAAPKLRKKITFADEVGGKLCHVRVFDDSMSSPEMEIQNLLVH